MCLPIPPSLSLVCTAPIDRGCDVEEQRLQLYKLLKEWNASETKKQNFVTVLDLEAPFSFKTPAPGVDPKILFDDAVHLTPWGKCLDLDWWLKLPAPECGKTRLYGCGASQIWDGLHMVVFLDALHERR